MSTSVEVTRDEVRELVQAGAAAPSGGNAQPWLVTASSHALEIFLDPERSESFIDVDRSASLLALGAFTENVRLAAEALGLEHRVERLGLDDLSRPVVRIPFTGRRPAVEPSTLYGAIGRRATNRKPHSGERVEEAELQALRMAARESGDAFDLRITQTDGEREAVAKVLAEADEIRTFNRGFHEQMLSEMRWTDEEAEQTADGVDVATLELPDGQLGGLRLMRHRWFVALFVTRNRIRTMTEAALAATDRLGCITMPRECSSVDLLRAGETLERVWLTATSRGLSVHPWSVLPLFALRAERRPDTLSPREVERILDLDRRMSEIMQLGEDGRAAFLFRLSRSEPPSVRALRRPWEVITRFDPSSPPRDAGSAEP